MTKQAYSEIPQTTPWDWNLPKLLIRRCREKGSKMKVADSMGVSLSGSDLLLRTLVLKRILDRDILASDEKNIGVLLPPTVPGAVVNLALGLSGRTAVNLNYTVSESIINKCIEQAGIKTVLTSGKVLEKFPYKLNARVVNMEEVRDKARLSDKISGLLNAKFLPEFMVHRNLGLNNLKPDDLLTIIFTSGSTGIPKGVPLTLNNVASNIQGFNRYIQVHERDGFLGILPFFHSFGFTVTLWGAMTLPSSAAYHFNPLEARQIGKLVESKKLTVLIGTPTFLRGYIRRIEPQQLKSIEVAIVGAEKMPSDLFTSFEEVFGVRPSEGYGATETSPVVSVNVPASRAQQGATNGTKEGSVGRPIPGVAVRIVSPEDGRILNTGEPGMLQVKGPNIMAGYYGQPELTEKVIVDGWYVTGDIGYIDDEGFIFITGRQSRFSKIGGEMVPHIKVEEAILQIIGDNDGVLNVGVAGVPDEKKGERLVVLYTEMSKSPAEINKELTAMGFPNLFIPGQDSYFKVDTIPILGTGKLDLKGLQDLAREVTA